MSDYHAYRTYLRESVIEPFYLKRLAGIKAMRLAGVLSRKNPYLFKAKNIDTPGDLARSVVDAYLSSQEETWFGDLMEGFAVFVSQTLYGGFKSARKSLDLEFRRDGKYYIVGIKSGTNWGNADQISTLKNNFKAARAALIAEGVTEEIVAVNGCIYGKDASPLKTNADPDKTYYKYAGQEFWRFVSGDDDLYREIIKPLDEEARRKSDDFHRAYTAKVNELTREFAVNFLDADSQMDWLKLVEYVSGREKVTLQTVPQAEAASDTQIADAAQSIAGG